MIDWKKLAAALDPPIPEPDAERIAPILEALEATFRPLIKLIPPGSDPWTGLGE